MSRTERTAPCVNVLHDASPCSSDRCEHRVPEYVLARRCPGTWWAPPPSKRLGRAIPVRRVRFPSTSATWCLQYPVQNVTLRSRVPRCLLVIQLLSSSPAPGEDGKRVRGPPGPGDEHGLEEQA